MPLKEMPCCSPISCNYIFDFGPFLEDVVYRSLTLASILFQVSWLSADSRFQASAIA